MGEEEEVIRALVKEMVNLAESEAEKIIKSAEEEAAKIINDAKERAKRLRETKVAQVKRYIRQRLYREYSLKKLSLRRRFINEKYEVLKGLMEKALREVLIILDKRDELYKESLKSLTLEALLNMDCERAMMRTREEDISILKEVIPEIKRELQVKGRNVELEVSPTPIKAMGGVFIECKDGKEYFNNTIDVRLRRVEEEVLPSLILG
ncbi:MAG: hypothetical protein DRJ41_04375 [Thermoprotei archaeon]|nr:MAG: hypothetical protein DRJ41_04375 [Thermoprotei archaeon]